MPALEQPWSVAALTQRIARSLEGFGPLTVRGELSQIKVSPSGHCYATLKDADAILPLVMWRSQVVRNGPLPKDGAQVLVKGSLSVYPPRGAYQLQATKIAAIGAGDLAQRFEELKARLLQEGLFASERKRPLPWLPRAVGIATAAGSAALADLLEGIRSRFPRMPIVHAPCLVQGSGAAGSIVAALERLQRHAAVDVIICGRGGGSLEDLWAFNEEAVVRAIARCAVPVISAVGHETDTTLSDLAADLRAKTPSAAGELVVPEAAELDERLAAGRRRLDQLALQELARGRARLAGLLTHRALAAPAQTIQRRAQRLDELRERLHAAAAARVREDRRGLERHAQLLHARAPAMRLPLLRLRLAQLGDALGAGARARVAGATTRVSAEAARLAALSPLAVLGRGYAVVFAEDGTAVRTLAQAPPGMRIRARVRDGELTARVESARTAPGEAGADAGLSEA